MELIKRFSKILSLIKTGTEFAIRLTGITVAHGTEHDMRKLARLLDNGCLHGVMRNGLPVFDERSRRYMFNYTPEVLAVIDAVCTPAAPVGPGPSDRIMTAAEEWRTSQDTLNLAANFERGGGFADDEGMLNADEVAAKALAASKRAATAARKAGARSGAAARKAAKAAAVANGQLVLA